MSAFSLFFFPAYNLGVSFVSFSNLLGCSAGNEEITRINHPTGGFPLMGIPGFIPTLVPQLGALLPFLFWGRVPLLQ